MIRLKSMQISKKTIDLIKKFEGFRSSPYLCSAGVPTIGYGNTFYPDGRKVTLSDKSISEEQGQQFLMYIVQDFANKVNGCVKVQLNDNQFGALISFAYNLGVGNLQKSTLLKKVNANPNDKTIRDEFLKWNRAGGKVLNGLVKRRLAESELYFDATL